VLAVVETRNKNAHKYEKHTVTHTQTLFLRIRHRCRSYSGVKQCSKTYGVVYTRVRSIGVQFRFEIVTNSDFGSPQTSISLVPRVHALFSWLSLCKYLLRCGVGPRVCVCEQSLLRVQISICMRLLWPRRVCVSECVMCCACVCVCFVCVMYCPCAFVCALCVLPVCAVRVCLCVICVCYVLSVCVCMCFVYVMCCVGVL